MAATAPFFFEFVCVARTRHPTCWDFSMTEFPDRVPVLLSSHAVGTVSNDPQELNTKNIPNSMGTHALPQDQFSLSPFPKIPLTDVPSPPFFFFTTKWAKTMTPLCTMCEWEDNNGRLLGPARAVRQCKKKGIHPCHRARTPPPLPNPSSAIFPY